MNTLEHDSKEKKAFIVIEKLEIRDKMQKEASNIISSIGKLARQKFKNNAERLKTIKQLKRHKNRFGTLKRQHKNRNYVNMKEDFERQFLKINTDLEELRQTMIKQIYDFQGRVEACDEFIKELEAENFKKEEAIKQVQKMKAKKANQKTLRQMFQVDEDNDKWSKSLSRNGKHSLNQVEPYNSEDLSLEKSLGDESNILQHKNEESSIGETNETLQKKRRKTLILKGAPRLRLQRSISDIGSPTLLRKVNLDRETFLMNVQQKETSLDDSRKSKEIPEDTNEHSSSQEEKDSPVISDFGEED